MVVIPFSFLPARALYKLSEHYLGVGAAVQKLFPHLQLELDRTMMAMQAKRYLAMCFIATLFLFVVLASVLTLLLLKIGASAWGPVIALLFCGIIFFMQTNYPKILAQRRMRKMDAELLDALRAILIQLNSGVPLFEAIVIISNQEFGEVSKEFKRVAQNINAGVPQIGALEEAALRNPSPYFRRTIWQVSNAMKEGAATKEVIASIISNLTKEQIIQIEKYGSQLSPLAMFYMMSAVILPVLGITFLIVLASFIVFDEFLLKVIFGAILGLVIFFQIMFSGIIKTKRPSLLGD